MIDRRRLDGEQASDRRDRHALVIGIDDYPYLHAKPLRGCRNDATAVRDLLLSRFEFRPDGIETLFDREATEQSIRDAMRRLIDRVAAGDIVVIHFSGHGSYLDLGPRRIETLVPHDSGRRQFVSRDLEDREFAIWLEELAAKTPYTFLILDTCHAGGLTRTGSFEMPKIDSARQRPRRMRSRFAPPGSPRPEVGSTATRRRRGGVSSARSGRSTSTAAESNAPCGWHPIGQRYTLLAACRAGEQAREVDDPDLGRWHGVFTLGLLEALRAEAGPIGCREAFERAAALVGRQTSRQHPQLEGARERLLFGREARASGRSFSILERLGRRIRVSGGRLHGLLVGDHLDLRTAGGGGVMALGKAQIFEVASGEAMAEIVAEASPDAVRSGDRAFLRERPPSVRYCTVAIAVAPELVAAKLASVDAAKAVTAWGPRPAGPAQLATRIEASPRMHLLPPTAERQSADLVVHRLAPRAQIGASTPVAQLGPLAAPTWVVTDQAGTPLLAPMAVGAATEDAQCLLEQLERLADRHALLDLVAKAPKDEPLRHWLEGAWLRFGADGRDEIPMSNGADRPLKVMEGDLLGARFRNGGPRSIFLTVFDVGMVGSVTQLTPVRGGFLELRPGETTELGANRETAFRLSIPADLPPGRDGRIRGVETLVIVVTLRPSDLSTWEQPARRSGSTFGPGRREFLRNFLDIATALCGTREKSFRARHDAWTAIGWELHVVRDHRLDPVEGDRSWTALPAGRIGTRR
ncbi:MAG: caspase family protein [Acidobacteriota bacterium]